MEPEQSPVSHLLKCISLLSLSSSSDITAGWGSVGVQRQTVIWQWFLALWNYVKPLVTGLLEHTNIDIGVGTMGAMGATAPISFPLSETIIFEMWRIFSPHHTLPHKAKHLPLPLIDPLHYAACPCWLHTSRKSNKNTILVKFHGQIFSQSATHH